MLGAARARSRCRVASARARVAVLRRETAQPGGRLPRRAPIVGAAMAVDPQRYRDVVGHFATGVAIVTAAGSRGPAGMTTNAVTSLSLDPLLLLVCFDNASR